MQIIKNVGEYTVKHGLLANPIERLFQTIPQKHGNGACARGLHVLWPVPSTHYEAKKNKKAADPAGSGIIFPVILCGPKGCVGPAGVAHLFSGS